MFKYRKGNDNRNDVSLFSFLSQPSGQKTPVSQFPRGTQRRDLSTMAQK